MSNDTFIKRSDTIKGPVTLVETIDGKSTETKFKSFLELAKVLNKSPISNHVKHFLLKKKRIESDGKIIEIRKTEDAEIQPT